MWKHDSKCKNEIGRDTVCKHNIHTFKFNNLTQLQKQQQTKRQKIRIIKKIWTLLNLNSLTYLLIFNRLPHRSQILLSFLLNIE